MDFGVYVNADNIAKLLRTNKYSFKNFKVASVDRQEFLDSVASSGLLDSKFTVHDLSSNIVLHKNLSLTLKDLSLDERLAQILAEYLRHRLIQDGIKLSFETVFSHPSKLDFLREARSRGYRLYLYFVSTEDPEINVARVKDIRVSQGGHDVPVHKIRSRYTNSMEQMFDAAQLADQAYFFDNSATSRDVEVEPFAHFRVVQGNKVWDPIDSAKVPFWFFEYYSKKAELKQAESAD